LEAAGRKYDQPTHYARKIMELQEHYDDNILDIFIGIAVDEDKMDIKSFRTLLRDYNSGKRPIIQAPPGNCRNTSCCDDNPALTRDCSYYEFITKEEIQCDRQ
jgi:hypothetical protein